MRDYTGRIHSINPSRPATDRSGFHAGIGNAGLKLGESVAGTINIQTSFRKHEEEIDRRDVLLPRCLPSCVRVAIIFYVNAETRDTSAETSTSESVSGCFLLNVPCFYVRSVMPSLRKLISEGQTTLFFSRSFAVSAGVLAFSPR